jgi:hypothetical protein
MTSSAYFARSRRSKDYLSPGMPVGSPGMEVGDQKDSYEVVAFRSDGSSYSFAKH